MPADSGRIAILLPDRDPGAALAQSRIPLTGQGAGPTRRARKPAAQALTTLRRERCRFPTGGIPTMPFASGRGSVTAHASPAYALSVPLACTAGMARGGIQQTEELLDYLSRYGARTDAVLDRVKAETAKLPNAVMQIAADQGALIELLVRLIGARNALEVGTFTGYSAICIARGLPEDGRLICLELDKGYAATAQRNLEAAGHATGSERENRNIRRCPRNWNSTLPNCFLAAQCLPCYDRDVACASGRSLQCESLIGPNARRLFSDRSGRHCPAGVRRGRVLPRWRGWTGLCLALLLVLSALARGAPAGACSPCDRETREEDKTMSSEAYPRVGVGVVGAGFVARIHAEAYRQVHGVQVELRWAVAAYPLSSSRQIKRPSSGRPRAMQIAL